MASHLFRKDATRRGGRIRIRRSRPCRFEALESRTLLAADITTGLVHHWKFDETAGDIAADSAGGSAGGSNGTLVNWNASEPKWEPGRVGGALRFSTADNYVIAQPPALPGTYAISFWLNVADRTGPNARIFTAKGGNVIFLNHESNRGVSFLSNSAVDLSVAAFSPGAPVFNGWEHYAINFNAATRQGVIYRSGAPVALGTFNDFPSLTSWIVGHHDDLNNHNDSLNGALDDVRVYDRVLTDEDIELLASLGTPEPVHQAPVHHWTFDETSGFTARDAAGGADGVLLNWNTTEPRWEPGKIGGALRFSTADNAVVTSAVSTQAQWSVAFWLNVTTRTGINPRVVEPWTYINQESNRGIGFTSRSANTFDPARVSLDKWDHYTITFDTLLDVGTIYRNGVVVAAGFFGDNSPAAPLIFGHQTDLGNHNDSLNGLLDDLRVYDRLLAPSEIAALADVPFAAADSYTAAEDTPLVVPVESGLLANDTGLAAAVLTASIVSTPSRGTIAASADGSFTYTPGPNLNGTDSFTYRASNGTNTSALTTVTINVAPVNDPPSFTKGPNQAITDESGPQEISAWATALSSGPADEAAQSRMFVVTTDNLALFAARPQVQANGMLTFSPAPNASGRATVTVVLQDNGGTASEGQNSSPPQTFTIDIAKAHAWRNINQPLDVSGDAVVSPIDAVLVINHLNAGNAGNVPVDAANGPPYLDTNGDDSVSAIDAVLVINVLNTTGTLFGPIPYRSAADSPFDQTGLGTSFWLENFEDGLLNTPGVSVINGSVRGPTNLTDSVDGDDGVIDGDGNLGHSYLVRPGSLGITFVFDPQVLGGLPRNAGIVVTGGRPNSRVEFYDAAGLLITTLKNPVYEAGIGIVDGDRFLGIFHPSGIRRIRIVNDGTGNQGLEVDHLQYGDILQTGEGELAADAAIGELFRPGD